jgi:large subunit ribosomal protein L4
VSDAATIEMISRANEPVGQVELPARIFAAPVREHLLYEAVRMQLANRRAGTHSTKTRGDVSGGGRKPWKQKGTGRARAGSSRSPIWVGGATIFGPQPRDYSYRMPNTARRSAIRSALSAKLRDGQVKLIDSLELAQAKTRLLAQMLTGLGVRSALILTAERDEALERAGRNLPNAKVLRVDGANVYDILRFDTLILTQASVAALEQRLAR